MFKLGGNPLCFIIMLGLIGCSDMAKLPVEAGIGAHVAPLGLTFYEGGLLPQKYAGGAFIGLHGSWNRKSLSGYKVVFVPFANGHPAGMPQDVLTSFISTDGKANDRPVGVVTDKSGGIAGR